MIEAKNKGEHNGSLIYPNEDVILICMQTKKMLKSIKYQNQSINTLFFQYQVLQHFHNSKIFSSLMSHSLKCNGPLSDHVTLLIKSITSTFIKLKVNYNLKS